MYFKRFLVAHASYFCIDITNINLIFVLPCLSFLVIDQIIQDTVAWIPTHHVYVIYHFTFYEYSFPYIKFILLFSSPLSQCLPNCPYTIYSLLINILVFTLLPCLSMLSSTSSLTYRALCSVPYQSLFQPFHSYSIFNIIFYHLSSFIHVKKMFLITFYFILTTLPVHLFFLICHLTFLSILTL